MKVRLLWPIFWALLGVFVLATSIVYIRAFGTLFGGIRLVLTVLAVLFMLGGALMVLTIDQRLPRMLKRFLLLAGASAAGIFFFVVLHNFMSGWFGLDEAVTFILATLICPLGFLVGAVGSIILKFWPGRKPPSRRR